MNIKSPWQRGLALLAVWSKVLPLSARCFSPLFGFESRPGHVRELPVTWGKAVVFAEHFGFLQQLQWASNDLAAIWLKTNFFYAKRNSPFHINHHKAIDKMSKKS